MDKQEKHPACSSASPSLTEERVRTQCLQLVRCSAESQRLLRCAWFRKWRPNARRSPKGYEFVSVATAICKRRDSFAYVIVRIGTRSCLDPELPVPP